MWQRKQAARSQWAGISSMDPPVTDDGSVGANAGAAEQGAECSDPGALPADARDEEPRCRIARLRPMRPTITVVAIVLPPAQRAVVGVEQRTGCGAVVSRRREFGVPRPRLAVAQAAQR